MQTRSWTASVPRLLRSIPTAAAMACIRCVFFVLVDAWLCTLHRPRPVVVRPWFPPFTAGSHHVCITSPPKETLDRTSWGRVPDRSNGRFPRWNQARSHPRGRRNHRDADRKRCVQKAARARLRSGGSKRPRRGETFAANEIQERNESGGRHVLAHRKDDEIRGRTSRWMEKEALQRERRGRGSNGSSERIPSHCDFLAKVVDGSDAILHPPASAFVVHPPQFVCLVRRGMLVLPCNGWFFLSGFAWDPSKEWAWTFPSVLRMGVG